MTCGGCSSRLKSVLTSSEGVLSAEISHLENSGVIITDHKINTEMIIQVINSAGFNVVN